MKVKNITSNNGNKIANQFIIYDSDGSKYFQSYNSVIAKIDSGNNITLDQKYRNYSNKTSKNKNKNILPTPSKMKDKTITNIKNK